MVEPIHPALLIAQDASKKAQHYLTVIADIKSVLEDEPNWVAAMATVSSVLHSAFDFYHWTGFYCVWPGEPEATLIVGPYQGSLGCRRIPFNRGVCGAAAQMRKTQLVPDVHAFEGHIACASSTQSEVVVPLLVTAPPDNQTSVLAVLDVDSNYPAAFDEVDVQHLEELCSWLADKYGSSVVQGS